MFGGVTAIFSLLGWLSCVGILEAGEFPGWPVLLISLRGFVTHQLSILLEFSSVVLLEIFGC